jgi:hypothetical protein
MIVTTSNPGKQSAEEARKERPRNTKVPTMKKNKPRDTNNHPSQIIRLKLCNTQKPRAILNTKERIQHHHRYLSQESHTCSD